MIFSLYVIEASIQVINNENYHQIMYNDKKVICKTRWLNIFLSVVLNSSHKIRIREVTQDNQILNRHISRVRQGFSKINPTEKLSIIIRKQN